MTSLNASSRVLVFRAFLAGAALVAHERSALAYSQASPLSGGSHEFLTIYPAKDAGLRELADLDLTNGMVADGDALEKMFTQRKSGNDRVYSAMVGQRWIDAMGFTKVTEGTMNSTWCLEAVAQRPDNVQYDHFLRKRCDEGDAGRRRAIEGSIAALKRYFIAAAIAPEDSVAVHHGGFSRQMLIVNRAYFMFGRAVHLFQDSFSEEHSIRTKDGKTIVDIKSYACTKNSPQHSHDSPHYFNAGSGDNAFEIYPSLPGNQTPASRRERAAKLQRLATSPVSFLKNGDPVRHAYRAMTALWTAFINARRSSTGPDAERVAAHEIDEVIAEWMRFIPSAHTVEMTEADKKWQRIGCEGYAPNQVDWIRKTCLAVSGTGGYDDSHLPPFRHMGAWDRYAEIKELDWIRAYRPLERTDVCTSSERMGPSGVSVGSSARIVETGDGYIKAKRGYICKNPSPCGKESERIARLERCSPLKIMGDVVEDRGGTKHENGAILLWIQVEVNGQRGYAPLVDIAAGHRTKECDK